MKPETLRELGHRILLVEALIGLLALASFLPACATVKTCAAPVTAQAIADGAAVLACSARGQALAACEEAQLAVEAGQLAGDALVCGELAVAAAAQGTHTAAVDAGAK